VIDQPFPEGAAVGWGRCQAPICHHGDGPVVDAKVGDTWRTAVDVSVCADALADFAIAPAALGGHVWARATDGLFHEVVSPDADRLYLGWVEAGQPIPRNLT